MPAPSSSSIPAALTQLDGAEALGDADVPHLLAYLAAIRDPRAPSGRRHPLIAILAMAAAAVLTGARSFAAIAEWAADAPQPVRAALGARREAPDHWVVPSEATIRRSLSRLDAEVLARVIGAWLADHGRPTSGEGPSRWTARRCGAHAATAARSICFRPWSTPAASCWPNTRSTAPLASPRVPAAACRPGVDRRRGHRRRVAHDPGGCGVPGHPQARGLPVHGQGQPARTAGALPAAGLASGAGAGPHPRPGTWPGGDPHAQGRQCARLRLPHTKQVIQVTRKVRDLGSRRWRTTTAYPVTSLVHAQASPARLADYLRGHWSIEALHHVRDTTFAEDTSQVRTGSAPQVMATLRNLAIGVLCRAGPLNLAAALRHHSRNPYRPLATLGISIG